MSAMMPGQEPEMVDTDGEELADAKAKREEYAAVRKWMEKINQSRRFDCDVYSQMAVDRAYARGESSFAVNVNLTGGAVDMMTAFLYAKDPDVACSPAAVVMEPKMPAPVMPDSVKMLTAPAPEPTGKPMKEGETMPPAGPMALPPEAQQMAMQDAQMYSQEMAQYGQIQAQKRAERDQRKRFCESLEIVISKSWVQGRMKRQAMRWVRAALTTGIGWLKIQWNERTQKDAVTLKRVADLQSNLAQLKVTRAAIEDGTGPELDALYQQFTEELMGLMGQAEVLVSRGLIIDLVNSEDMTFPVGLTDIMEYTDSPWIDQRIFMSKDEAQVMFPDLPMEKLKSATTFSQRRPAAPEMGQSPEVVAGGMNLMPSLNPSQFVSGSTGLLDGLVTQPGTGDFVCIHETWDRDAGVIRTMIEGVECYAKPPYAPDIATTRFYGFFGLAFTEADNTRYPQSLCWRSHRLVDEFNSARTAWKNIRQRALQGVLFDGTKLDAETATRLQGTAVGEWTMVKLINPEMPIGSAFMPKPYSPIDPAVYDTSPILRDFERIWGLQEALQGSVQVEKTATEAEIQQQGLGQTSAYKRDILEGVLTDIANYTAEIVLQRLDGEDVKVIAGPAALWPEQFKADDLATMVDVKIWAGTTGKPNTTAERQSWGAIMPMVQNMIGLIGQYRGAGPSSMADSFENLLAITLDRAGDTVDVASLVPQEADGGEMPAPGQDQMGQPAPNSAPQPGQPGSPDGGLPTQGAM